MSTTKDYYEILGVPKSASDDQVKQAYRKLAREHHPDMVKDGDKSKAEQRFKEINEAYQVLRDPQKRKMYDQFGHAGTQAGYQQAGQQGWGPFTYTYTTGGQNFDFGDFDPFDVFEEFFGFRGFGGRARSRKGKNLYYEMESSFGESVNGVEREISVESGKFKIKIPAGVKEGMEMRFSGKGMPGPTGMPAGDLYLTFRVKTPPQFHVVGNDVGVGVEIDFVQAILGSEVEIPVVESEAFSGVSTAKLKVPAGTQNGTQFRIRGKGMPDVNGRGRGDVIVQVHLIIPKKLSKKQKDLLEEYRRL